MNHGPQCSVSLIGFGRILNKASVVLEYDSGKNGGGGRSCSLLENLHWQIEQRPMAEALSLKTEVRNIVTSKANKEMTLAAITQYDVPLEGQ